MGKLTVYLMLAICLLTLGACGMQEGGLDMEQVQLEDGANLDGDNLGGEKLDEDILDGEQVTAEVVVKGSYKNRLIRVGAIDFPPYEYLEDGQLKGPYVDIVTRALDQLGYDYKVEAYPWSRLLELAKTGELDMVIDVFDLMDRRSFLYYPEEPIGLYNQNLFTLENSGLEYDGDFSSLQNHVIGVVQDYSYGEVFDRAVEEGLIRVESSQQSDDNFNKLLQNRVDLIIEDMGYAMNYFSERGNANKVRVLEPSVSSTYTYVGFSKTGDLGQLRVEVDTALKEMKANGTFYRIFEDYNMSYYGNVFKAYQKTNPPPDKYFQNEDAQAISISILDETPPYVFMENGEYKGLIVDIVQEAFNRMGIRYELQAIPFNRSLNQLKEGTLDVGTDIFIKPERELYLHYPVNYPIAVYPYTIFKLKDFDFEFHGDPEELIDYRIGYIRGYSLGTYDKYIGDERFTFVAAESPEANMNLLINGRVDFVIDVRSTGESIAKAMGVDDKVHVVLPPIDSNASYVAFSKTRGLDKLVKEYEYAIESMLNDGTLEGFYKKYDVAMPLNMKKIK